MAPQDWVWVSLAQQTHWCYHMLSVQCPMMRETDSSWDFHPQSLILPSGKAGACVEVPDHRHDHQSEQALFILSVSIWLILNSHSKRDWQIRFRRDYLNTHFKTGADSIKTFRFIRLFRSICCEQFLNQRTPKPVQVLVGFTLYNCANTTTCAPMLPGRVCGMYLNITGIKTILLWDICKTLNHQSHVHSSLESHAPTSRAVQQHCKI